MNIISKTLALLLLSCSIYASSNIVLKDTWNAERYVDGNKELPYSTFTINLEIDTNNKVTGDYCFVTRWGKKIDCFNDETKNIEGLLKNKKIKVEFYSSWGGKHGKANISFDSECNLQWELIQAPDGDFYVPKTSLLIRKNKTDNCAIFDNLQIETLNKIELPK